jgi:ureidoglycolate hydrolase
LLHIEVSTVNTQTYKIVDAVPISAEGFKPFGRVIDLPDGHAISTWLGAAAKILRGQVEAMEFDFPAGSPSVSAAEIHRRTAQLTVTFDAPWLATIFIDPPTAGGRARDRRTAAFVVPPGIGVVIRRGLWHGPITALGATHALVCFRANKVAWTEVTKLEDPLIVTLGDFVRR